MTRMLLLLVAVFTFYPVVGILLGSGLAFIAAGSYADRSCRSATDRFHT